LDILLQATFDNVQHIFSKNGAVQTITENNNCG